MYFIVDEMSLNFNETIAAIEAWGIAQDKLSANFFTLDMKKMDLIRQRLFEVASQLWLHFKNKNMFDFNNVGNLSFPFVLKDIAGTNLMLIKDNVISSNEVNIYGSNY